MKSFCALAEIGVSAQPIIIYSLDELSLLYGILKLDDDEIKTVSGFSVAPSRAHSNGKLVKLSG